MVANTSADMDTSTSLHTLNPVNMDMIPIDFWTIHNFFI